MNEPQVSPWMAPVLRTARLAIRPFSVDDLGAVYAYASGHPASGYGSWLGGNAPEDVARYLTDTISRYGRPPRADLGVTLDGQIIGGLGFRQVWISPPTMEIGWVLNPAVAGRGMAREAVGALLDHLFTAFPDMSRAEARVRTTDSRGIHILEGLGFQREGTLRTGAGTDGDACLYGLLRAERVV